MMAKDRIFLGLGVCVRCVLLVVVPTGWAADPPDCGPEIPREASGWQHNPEAEQWFRQQVERGADARFELRFAADVRQRAVRASVVEDLLLQSRRTARLRMKGVVATCAVVVGSLGLRYAEVPEPVSLKGFTFQGDVDLSWTHFKKTLRLNQGHFHQDVSFNTATLEQALFLTDATFEGEADFGAFETGGALVATGARFRNPSKDAPAIFNSAKVGNTMFFDGAVFQGPTDFRHVSIGLDFKGEGLQAPNKAFPLDFRHMKAHSIRFTKALLAGQVWLGEVTADAIQLESLQRPVSGPPSIDLGQAVIRGQLSIKDAVLEDLIAPQIRVDGVAELRQVTINRWLNLQHASFVHCALIGVTLPADRWQAWFDGASYEYISFTGNDLNDKFSALFQWPLRVRYSASVYTSLEKFLTDQGYSDAAKQVAVAQRRDDRARLSGIDWLSSCLLDGLIGYGKHPFRAIWACLVVVIVGTFVFRWRAGMEVTKAEYADQWYSPVWYSLGLFLPVVDLEMSKVWRPSSDRRWARHYMRLHILLGWILVPLFAAGLTGLVK